MKTEFFNIFNEKQLEAIKLIINKGLWGNADIEFSKNKTTNEAFGYFTNMHKGKEFSGLLSGISKTITKSGTSAIKMCPDWWGDGTGDMMFFNMDLLECTYEELDEWASAKSEIEKIIAKAENQSIKEDVKKYGKSKFVKDVAEYIENKTSTQVQFINLLQVFKAMH